MKRIIVSLTFILVACYAWAQTLDSIPHHVVGYYGPHEGGQMDNVSQMSDGNILFLHKIGINMNITNDCVGNVHYKVSRHGGILLDTLFVADSDPSFYMFAKNPNGDDNLRVGIVRDSTEGVTFLQIFPFDNDLNYDTLNEVFVPLSDTLAFIPQCGCILDKQNSLVMTYSTPTSNGDSNRHFASFELDGTLKHENTVPESSIPMNLAYHGFGIFNESPLEYCWYGLHHDSPGSPKYVVCYLFDSLFQYKDSFTITRNNSFYNFEYILGWDECLLSDGDDFIFGCRYERGAMNNGVCLVRYDKRTREQKNVVYFKSRPMINSSSIGYGACPIGLVKDSEGCFYYAYDTQNLMFTDKGQVAVAKLDADFNVLWQRFCLEPEGFYRHGSVITVLDDGGVAVGGGYMGRPEVFFLIVNDDYDGMEEQGVFIRPYACYPNPAQDELRLHYSPDVTPTQIELYDLQGRLVKTQRTGLESLNLQGIAAGTYTMRVTLQDGKVFSDKVIKE